MTLPPSRYGTLCIMQHRNGVRRWRGLAAKDIRVQEKGMSIQGGRNMGHFPANR